LSREVLAGIRVAVKPHSSFTRVWTSEATGSRRAASFWHAKFEQSFAARNRDRVPLGSYATPGLADPSRYAPVTATGSYGPSGKHANALEVTDTKAWAMAGSPHLNSVIDALFPHPVRFRQVWGQEWKHVSAFAWAAVPPPGFVALGMALTNSPTPPDVNSLRCVPKQWTRPASTPPKLVWENAGGGGRAASVWIVNDLGVAHVVLGHDPPETKDCLELVPASSMLPEDILAPKMSSDGNKNESVSRETARSTRDVKETVAVTKTSIASSSVSSSASLNSSSLYGSTSGDYAPPLRGRAAMFESVAEERRKEQAVRDAREREAREREERRRVAALGASSGADIFAGAFDVFGSQSSGSQDDGFGQAPAIPQSGPTLVSVAPAAPRSAATQAQRAADANPFAASAPGPIPGMDLLTGSPAPSQNADPLGALDPLGAGAPVRVKKEPTFIGAAAARRNKKAE
jgi:hypothetical protein